MMKAFKVTGSFLMGRKMQPFSMEVASKDVQVALTLPTGWFIEEFHGESYSTSSSAVEPQHLSPNDTMVFHQLIDLCGPLPVSPGDQITATATYKDPISLMPSSETTTDTVGGLLVSTSQQMIKGDAIIRYAQTLKEIQTLMYNPANYTTIVAMIDSAQADVLTASATLGSDSDLNEIAGLLLTYRDVFTP